jgi:hypothetical protein
LDRNLHPGKGFKKDREQLVDHYGIQELLRHGIKTNGFRFQIGLKVARIKELLILLDSVRTVICHGKDAKKESEREEERESFPVPGPRS